MNFKKIAQKIALTALAGITVSNNTVMGSNDNNLNALLGNENEDKFKISEDKPILILKKTAVDFDKYIKNPASHRSHRSHSSHRSHYSSRTYSPPSRTYSPSKSNNTKVYTSPNTSLSLGSRTLKYPMSGDDVKELNTILYEKGFLTSFDRYSNTFSSSTKEAVEKIQKQNAIEVTGVVNSLTLIYIRISDDYKKEPIKLNKYSPSVTHDSYTPAKKIYRLGDRVLKLGVKGNDVLELKLKFNSDGLFG